MKEFKTSKYTITDRSSDSVARYFHDVNRYRLLSQDEEAELAHAIRRGGADAKAARERLVNANLRFVISIANSYKTATMPLADLISEGNIGLVKAADRFDETRGIRFISFAVWWIRQSIMAALDKSGTMLRLPSNQQKMLREFQQMQKDILQAEQRTVSVDEFCDVSGYDYDNVVRVLESASNVVKLDDSVGDDTDRTHLDFLASDSLTDASLDKESLHHDLMRAIDMLLTEKEALALKGLYGIGRAAMSYEGMADMLNLSRERTRQITKAAINKLHNSQYASRLRMHLAA